MQPEVACAVSCNRDSQPMRFESMEGSICDCRRLFKLADKRFSQWLEADARLEMTVIIQ